MTRLDELREALRTIFGERIDVLLTQMGCTEYCIKKEREALDSIELMIGETIQACASAELGWPDPEAELPNNSVMPQSCNETFATCPKIWHMFKAGWRKVETLADLLKEEKDA